MAATTMYNVQRTTHVTGTFTGTLKIINLWLKISLIYRLK